AAVDRFHHEIMTIDLGKIILYAEKRFVAHLAKSFGFADERVVDRVQLRGGHDLAGAGDGLSQDNLCVAYGVVRFIKSAAVVVSKIVDDAISAFSKDLIIGKHSGRSEASEGWDGPHRSL